MVGIAWLEPRQKRFVVKQSLSHHPDEERMMLAHLLARMEGRTHIVAYNVRSFDWPMLVN